MVQAGLLVRIHSLCVNTGYLLMCSIRPTEFAKKSTYPDDSDEEESTVGKMPPSESEEDEGDT